MSFLLDQDSLESACRELADRDADLARVLNELGLPPLWARDAGFPTLVHIILEQQVSLASARAAFEKLKAAVNPLTPQGLLRLSDAEMKAAGFSRQKTGYARGLAQAVLTGEVDLDRLAELDDTAAREELLKIRGIGGWSADIYLLMALRRPDVWPAGDLALAQAVQQVKGLPARPDGEEMAAIAAPWRPWRAAAARMCWHYYLSRMVKKSSRGNENGSIKTDPAN